MNPTTLAENKKVVKDGSAVVGNARKEIEEKTGKSVLTGKTASNFTNLLVNIITANLQNVKDDENEKS